MNGLSGADRRAIATGVLEFLGMPSALPSPTPPPPAEYLKHLRQRQKIEEITDVLSTVILNARLDPASRNVIGFAAALLVIAEDAKRHIKQTGRLALRQSIVLKLAPDGVMQIKLKSRG